MKTLQKARIVLWTLVVVAVGGIAATTSGVVSISVPQQATVVAGKAYQIANIGDTLDPHENENTQLAKLRSLIGRQAGS